MPSSVPDQPHGDHSQLAALRLRYPEWTIEPPAALHVWTAELTTEGGRSVHFLAGHDIEELADRLATATALDS